MGVRMLRLHKNNRGKGSEVWRQRAVVALLPLFFSACTLEGFDESAAEDGDQVALSTRILQQANANQLTDLITEAEWDREDGELKVKGRTPSNEEVLVFNVADGSRLGVARGRDSGRWELEIENISPVPCQVRAENAAGMQTVMVDDAPADCVGAQSVASGLALIDVEVKWDDDDGELKVKGGGVQANETITVFDSESQQLLGSERANSRGGFKFKLRGLAMAPCFVDVVAGAARSQIRVREVPQDCGPAPLDNNGTTVTENQLPRGAIVSPVTDLAINVGTSVTFTAAAIDPDGDLPLTYHWKFGNAAQDSFEMQPTVTFNEAGIYRVSMTVTDVLGGSDPEPPVRVVVVQNPNGSIGGGATELPEGLIVQPTSSSVSVNVNETVFFSATGNAPNGEALAYFWDFGVNARPQASTTQNPGAVQFTQAGVYEVSLRVVDALGNVDPTPDTRTVVVGNTTNANPPNGQIVTPAADITINAGESVNFQAVGSSPLSGEQLTYLWNFDGATNNINQQNPGNIVFSRAGVYSVSLTVSDSRGVVDPSPAVRVITVLASGNDPTGVNQAPQSTILSPNRDVSVAVGGRLTFAGSAQDPENNAPFIYLWDFDDAIPNTTAQNPGEVVFNRVGTFRVRLTVRDNLGATDDTPAEVMVTVVDPGNTRTPPQGVITSPASTDPVTIQVGDSLSFAAGVVSGNNNSPPYSYEWDFDGAAENVTTTTPGSVTFNQVGTYRVTMVVRDSQGLADPTPSVRFITVENPNNRNQAPHGVIVSPLSDLTIDAGSAVEFVGSGNDPEDGQAILYHWTFGGAFADANTASPGFKTFNNPGVYDITLRVSDAQGLSDPVLERRRIRVRDSNATAPQATISSPSATTVNIVAGDSVSFLGSASGSGTLMYHWSFDGGAADSMVQNPGVVVFEEPGTYRVSLLVKNEQGLRQTNPPTRTIVVAPQTGSVSTQAPDGEITTPASDVTISVGQTLRFAATGSDADNDFPLVYRWDYNGAAPSTQGQEPGNLTFTAAGTYRIRMTVTDSTGATDATPAERIVTVRSESSSPGLRDPNGVILSPSANQSINVGGTVNFQGVGSDPDGDVLLSYIWDFDGAVPNSTQQNPGLRQFNTAGVYRVRFIVTDSTGRSDPTPDERIITVGNVASGSAPNGTITMPPANKTVEQGDAVHFMAEGTGAQGVTLEYFWNFDSTNVDSSWNPTSSTQSPGDIIFDRLGTYIVTLNVTDSNGVADPTPAQRVISVVAPNNNGTNGNSEPIGYITSPRTDLTIRVGSSVTFEGLGVDPENDQLIYRWDFGSVAGIINQQNPGAITFNERGTFLVTLTVTDSKGLSDRTPVQRIITVQ